MEVISSPFSNFLYEKAPNKYSNEDKQEDYLDRAQKAVELGVRDLQKTGLEKKSFKDAFHRIQGMFSEIRQKIALDHKTNLAPFFGKSRALPKKGNEYASFFTVLTGAYADYNVILKQNLCPILDGMTHGLDNFTDTMYKEREKVVDDRLSSLTIEVLNPAEKKVKVQAPSFKEFQKALGDDITAEKLRVDTTQYLKLRKENMALYKAGYFSVMYRNLERTFPSIDWCNEKIEENQKDFTVLTTIRLEVNKRLVPIGGHLTWMCTNGKDDPVTLMRERSKAFVLHQDSYLVDETMAVIAEIFEKCVLWDKASEDLDLLKGRVAMLRYAYAYCMPNYRGDGAIGDWLEMMIYRYHGFLDTSHNPEKLPCFEPLSALTFKQYRAAYEDTITVVSSSKVAEKGASVDSITEDGKREKSSLF